MLREVPEGFRPVNDLLSGRSILVAGAASDVEREVALACARFGTVVDLLDHHSAALEELFDDIFDSGAPAPAIVEFDLRKLTVEAGASLAQQIDADKGELDGLVHAPI